MENELVRVSVIVPLFNEEKFIEKCLQSLIAQTYPKEKMEWILVDGASTDRTVEIIKSHLNDGPIVLLNNEKRKTPYALNMGIEQAKGEYIIRLDAHSSFPPEYIEKCVHYLDTTDADNVGGVAETESKGYIGEAISQMLSTKFGVGNSQFRTNGESGYVDTVPFGAFRREVFDKVGLFNPKLLRSEDNDMNARIRAAGGKVWLAQDIRFKYYCRDTVGGLLKMGMQNGNALFRTLKENPKAMSLRHFIPFLFVASLLVLIVGSIFLPIARWALLAEASLYGLLDVYFSFGKCKVKYAITAIWLYPLFHICYGLGSLLGMIGIKLY